MSHFDAERVAEYSSTFAPTPQEAETTVTTTGTTTLAMSGADGVVLAADARASLGGRFVTNRSMRKVERIDDRTALTVAGSVAEARSFCRQLRAESRLYRLRHGRSPAVATTARLAATLVRTVPYHHLSLLFGGFDDEPIVYDIDPGGGLLASPYAASGSGMQLAYGVLEGRYDPEHAVADLRALAVAAIRAATERDTASGDGLTLATITAEDVSLESFGAVTSAVDRYVEGNDRDGAQAGEGVV